MRQFGNHVARIAAVFMIFSTGMFISAAGRLQWKFWLFMHLMNSILFTSIAIMKAVP